MGKYIRITRPELGGSCVTPLSDFKGMIEGEIEPWFDDFGAGDSIILECVEISDEEYSNYKEFQGW